MSEKRYQVFLSSTFRDLKEERQAVLDAILQLRHIPAGMEIFPAADSTPWEMIRQIIADSDYYVLIIGGRYGSSEEDGISYTEREYALAVELGKQVLVFPHAAPETLALEKNETDKKLRRKLEAFRKVAEKHTCKHWRTTAELQTYVIVALATAIQTRPTSGWVRANGYNDTELLRRLADLQQRYDRLQEENQLLRERLGTTADTSGYAQGTERIPIAFRVDSPSADPHAKPESVLLSWDEMFFGLGSAFMAAAQQDKIETALSAVIFGAFVGTEECAKRTDPPAVKERLQSRCIATHQSIRTVVNQFAALGLIEPHLVSRPQTSYDGKPYTTLEDSWRLTSRGREKYFAGVALPAASAGFSA